MLHKSYKSFLVKMIHDLEDISKQMNSIKDLEKKVNNRKGKVGKIEDTCCKGTKVLIKKKTEMLKINSSVNQKQMVTTITNRLNYTEDYLSGMVQNVEDILHSNIY